MSDDGWRDLSADVDSERRGFRLMIAGFGLFSAVGLAAVAVLAPLGTVLAGAGAVGSALALRAGVRRQRALLRLIERPSDVEVAEAAAGAGRPRLAVRFADGRKLLLEVDSEHDVERYVAAIRRRAIPVARALPPG